jgi:type II secretory pathway component PulK
MSNRRGLALIIVLAIVAILSVLVIEFSYSVWVDLYLSANYLSRTQAVEAAKAGVEYAIYVLRRDADRRVDSLGEEWAQPMEITIGELVPPPDPEADEDEQSTDWYADLGKQARARLVEPRAGGTAHVLIVDEERKIGVNGLESPYRPIFVDMLERLIDELNVPNVNVSASELVEQMIDWVDEDDVGSWEYVYEMLPEPYVAMNRPFDTLDELRLLADMTDALLYGTVPYPEVEPGYSSDEKPNWVDYESPLGPDDAYGLINFVHCQSPQKINVNTAPREVLTALFDGNTIVAEEIIEKRREEPFSETGRLKALVTELGGEYDDLKHGRWIDFRSSFYTITSVGEYRGVKAKVTALVFWSDRDVTIQYYRIENAE